MRFTLISISFRFVPAPPKENSFPTPIYGSLFLAVIYMDIDVDMCLSVIVDIYNY